MEMIPFTYQDSPVRTIENDGRVLFCGKDVAVALGYKDPTNALKQHCRGVAKHHPIGHDVHGGYGLHDILDGP